jgi:hypothetical protein
MTEVVHNGDRFKVIAGPDFVMEFREKRVGAAAAPAARPAVRTGASE